MLKVKAVKCGKKQCKKCPHGWYIYAQRKQKGVVKDKYLGKHGEALTTQRIYDLAKIYPQIIAEYEKISQKLSEDTKL